MDARWTEKVEVRGGKRGRRAGREGRERTVHSHAVGSAATLVERRHGDSHPLVADCPCLVVVVPCRNLPRHAHVSTAETKKEKGKKDTKDESGSSWASEAACCLAESTKKKVSNAVSVALSVEAEPNQPIPLDNPTSSSLLRRTVRTARPGQSARARLLSETCCRRVVQTRGSDGISLEAHDVQMESESESESARARERVL
eukprot:699877-Rhodomonas_salina.1